MSPLRRPPEGPQEGLRHFPEHVLAAAEPLFRIHRSDRGPWWFGADGAGRFDLASPRGTCYLAEDPLGALVEVFRDTHLVPEAEARRRSLSRLELPRPLRLADCVARQGRIFGLTGAIHSTPDYELTHAWAAAFAAAGFDGVRYLVSHDPAQRLAGYALFGDAGEPADEATWPPGEPEEIGPDLLRRALHQFGLLVVPAR